MKYGEKGPYHSSVESLASDHLGKTEGHENWTKGTLKGQGHF